MRADVIPFPRRHTEADAHRALEAFLEATIGALATYGVQQAADLPSDAREVVDRHAARVVALLDELGPVLPGVEVVDGRLTFRAPA